MWRDGRYLVGMPEDAAGQPGAGQEAVLLVDEGVHFFELRAIYVRGSLKPSEAPEGAPAGRVWFELLPGKTVAWDYGRSCSAYRVGSDPLPTSASPSARRRPFTPCLTP